MAKRKRENFTPEQEEIATDLDVAAALDVVAISEGGKMIVKGLLTDIVGVIETLSVKYDHLTIQQFVALCASMKEKLDLMRAITRAPKTRADLQEKLDELLKE